MTPEEILLKAANDLAENGHCKGSFYASRVSHDGWRKAPACAYGALARVTELTSDNGIVGVIEDSRLIGPAAERLAKQIRKLFPDNSIWQTSDAYTVITTYNDNETTTAEDMILRFKEAAHG